MPSDLSAIWTIPAALAGMALMLCFLCSLSAAALQGASAAALRSAAEKEEAHSKTALGLKTREDRHLPRLITAVCFCLLTSGACLWQVLLWCFLSRLAASSLPGVVLAAAVVLSLLLIVWLIGSFGILLPLELARRHPERTLQRASRPARIISAVFAPLTLACQALPMLLVKAGGRGSGENPAENPTEEKILMMVDEGEENGTIEENTKSMIENVFEFDDTTVGEIMTHRKDVVAVRDDETLGALTRLAIESGRSRIPVYHEDIDDITGIINVKDLLKYIGTGCTDEPFDRSVIREAVFVPASKRCSEMFEYMTAHKTQIAVVVDEFGGTGGIITMEDLIESILGNIQDEYDNEEDGIQRVNEYSFTVDGATPLDEIEELTGVHFDGDENASLAGIMLDRMGHIPRSGEHPSVMIDGTRFTVLEADQRRISRVLIVKSHHLPSEKQI